MASRKRTRNGEPVEATDNVSIHDLHRYPALYSSDELAKKIRDECDYSLKITLDEAKNGLAPRKVRVYCDGIYDMFHSGHARQLMQVQIAIPNCHLIIGVCSDKLTHRRKGRTVMTDRERYEAVRHCRYVDELVTDAPWTIDEAYLLKHKIDFVAHDDLPYSASGSEDIYKWLKDKGMFLATQRTEGISTTDVIARIIKDYDMYVRRNLGRGYSRKDLNVGFMKEKKIQFEMKVDKMKGEGKKLVDKWKENGNELMTKWEEKSKEFIGNFVDLFGRDGRISTWFQESKHKIGRAMSPTFDDDEDYDDDSSLSRHSTSSSPVDAPSSPLSPPSKKTRLDFSPSSSVSELDISDNEYDETL